MEMCVFLKIYARCPNILKKKDSIVHLVHVTSSPIDVLQVK